MVRPAASGENEVLAMADRAINIKPNEDELVEIAAETVDCAKIFGVDPKVAFLSYSTFGSGKGEDVDKMRNAANKAKLAMPNVPIEGELQFDAAVSPRVAKTTPAGIPCFSASLPRNSVLVVRRGSVSTSTAHHAPALSLIHISPAR